MERIAVFPGSFDPVTRGHTNLVKRCTGLFDKIIVAIGHNSRKKTMFTLEQRLSWLSLLFKDYPQVEIAHYEGLTVDFCKKVNARFLVRGIRNGEDFNYEQTIANLNHELHPFIETVFLAASPDSVYVSSTIVREILLYGGDAAQFLPAEIASDIQSAVPK